MQTVPGCASASSRAATLTPSPNMSSPSTMTSPRLTPIRNSRRRSVGMGSLISREARCISTAHFTASTTLGKSASKLSPAVPTIRPPCAAINGSTALRSSPSALCVAASSSPIKRLKATTSACRMAASFRFREENSPENRGELSSSARIANAFDLATDEAHYTSFWWLTRKELAPVMCQGGVYVEGLLFSTKADRDIGCAAVRDSLRICCTERRTEALNQRLRSGRLFHRRKTRAGQDR